MTTPVTLEDLQSSDNSVVDIKSYLAAQENKSLLRFLTCGSVDDGKSTLIGRLLFDSKRIFEDQLATLEADSKKHGTMDGDFDFALLLDGLEAEREQGITIDVAYRFFTTDKRKFIVADTPGHEEYTRNMATGASTADLAIVLVDATQGILPQTRRHSFIASLLGIKNVVLAVNKIDLEGYSEEVFNRIDEEYRSFVKDMNFSNVTTIPISARFGDNVTSCSKNTRWYQGVSLLEHLETIDITAHKMADPFRLPVQYVCRPDATFRGFAGTIASGAIKIGDTVQVAKSGKTSAVKSLVAMGDDGAQILLESAKADQAVMMMLSDEVDISRGDMIVESARSPDVTDQFMAHIVSFSDDSLIPGRNYIIKTACEEVSATITTLKHRIDINDFSQISAKSLAMNEIGVCNIKTQRNIVFDAYDQNKQTGAFVIIDRLSNMTVGAGMIDYPLRRADNSKWQELDVTKQARAEHKQQKPLTLWFTGLSGSGKSTIANLLEKSLFAKGKHSYILDGDNVRHGLNKDLGFVAEDRIENIRRVSEVAKLMTDAGLIVLVSFISPFKAERKMARRVFEEGEYVEIFVDTPFDECAKRDTKGLYKKALAGELLNFTGLDSPYEAPETSEIHLKTVGAKPEDMVAQIEAFLEDKGYI